MKTPEEYLKFIEFAEVDASEAGMFYFADNLEKGELIKLIQQVQKEAWNEALDKAAENADADIYFKGWLAEQEPFVEGEDYEVYVLNQSILKLKL